MVFAKKIANKQINECVMYCRCISLVRKPAEAEVVPSSSLVEVKVDVGVEVEVEVEVEVGVEFGVEVGFLRCNSDVKLVVHSTFTGGWVVGRLEGNAKLNSRSD